MVANKIIKQLGVDQYNRFEYIPEIENDELIKNEWKGRTWGMQNAIVGLRMVDAFGLTLTMHIGSNTAAK